MLPRHSDILQYSSCGFKNLHIMQQVLDLSCCRGVGDAGVAAVAAAGARLHTLSLSSCHQLTDAAFAALGARCGALAHLNACGCELLGDAGLAALAAGARCWPGGFMPTIWHTCCRNTLGARSSRACAPWCLRPGPPRWQAAPGSGWTPRPFLIRYSQKIAIFAQKTGLKIYKDLK